jgi:hypothetical protein
LFPGFRDRGQPRHKKAGDFAQITLQKTFYPYPHTGSQGVYMTVIKSIEIISWAKIHALFGIVFGLIYGVLFAILGTAIGAAFSMPGATTLGLLSIIVFPIIFGIMAFICGAIMAFLYNIFACKIGGIEVELVEKKP